jgi:hypothetical protein
LAFVDETICLWIVTEYCAWPVFQVFLKLHALHVSLRVFLSIPHGAVICEWGGGMAACGTHSCRWICQTSPLKFTTYFVPVRHCFCLEYTNVTVQIFKRFL